MKTLQRYLLLGITLFTGMVWLLPAQAIPAFARETGVRCSYCHNAWPQLNAKGRAFKERGYRMPDQVDQDMDLLDMLKKFPIAATVVARPADKKDSGDLKFRSLHAVEFWFAGPVSKHFSIWSEIEAEDEGDFSAEGNGSLLYNYNRHLNVRAGYTTIFFDDPYGFLLEHFKLTGPIAPAIIDSEFGGGDTGPLAGARQLVSVYGRVLDNRVFYSMAYGGNVGDVEGVDPRVVMGRIAFDFNDDMHIGGFYIDGSQGSVANDEALTIINGMPAVEPASITPKTDFSRYGVDGHIDYRGFRLHGAWIHSEDNLHDGAGNQNNDIFSVLGFYTFRDDTGRPTWVPLISYDDIEENDGADNFGLATFQLGYYLTGNTKIFGQYSTEVKTPSGDKKNDRFTLQVQVLF